MGAAMSKGAIIGPHISGSVSPFVDTLSLWQPRLALKLIPKREDMQLLKAVCPNTTTIARVYVEDNEMNERIKNDPEGAAQWAHGLIVNNEAFGLVDYWAVENEVCPFWDQRPNLNRYLLRRMQLANEANYHGAMDGTSTGQPDLPENDRAALWRQVDESMEFAERWGHIWIAHQYGTPTLWGPDSKGGADWNIHRLEKQVLPLIPYKKLKFGITEYGIDGLITGKKAAGWAAMPGASAKQYAQDLINIGQYCEQWSDRILGYCVYCLGSNGDAKWDTYRIDGEVVDILANHYHNIPIEIPPQEPATATLADALRTAFGEAFTDLRAELETGAETYQTRQLDAINRIVIHHTATPTTTTWETVAHYHVASKGWPGIGYHIGVNVDGSVHYVGDIGTIRWHAGGANTDSIGVSCMGNFDTDEPPQLLLDTLVKVIHVLNDFLSPQPLGVFAHREVMAGTVCPGRFLFARMSDLRTGRFVKVLPAIGLRCRSTANVNSQVIGVWPQGAVLTVLEEDAPWLRVTGSLNGLSITGWSHGDYLEEVT